MKEGEGDMGRDRDTVFCSGGNDKTIAIWDLNGEIIGTINREEEENVYCMLCVGNKIITASNSSLIYVYDLTTLKFVEFLYYHRESVRCLTKLSKNMFASGSLDGAIAIWDAETLKTTRSLSLPGKFQNVDHIYMFHVRHMCSLGERYLAAAVGKGFSVYDISNGECVMELNQAHDAPVSSFIPLYNGTKIVTCSEDGFVKLWGTKEQVNFTVESPQQEDQNYGIRNFLKKRKPVKVAAICVGEMMVHSNSVNYIVQLDETSFASCGSDELIVLWKDGDIQSKVRNNFASASLFHYHSLYPIQTSNTSVPHLRNNGSSPVMDTDLASPPFSPPNSSYLESSFLNESAPVLSSSNQSSLENFGDSRHSSYSNYGQHFENSNMKDKKHSAPESVEIRNTPNIPQHLWQFAENLRTQKNFSIDDISQMIREMNHSEAIINAISEKQKMAEMIEKNNLENPPNDINNSVSIEIKNN